MRRISVLCAAAGLAVTAFVAASPAEAGYQRASASVPTFVDALAMKDTALKTGKCTW